MPRSYCQAIAVQQDPPRTSTLAVDRCTNIPPRQGIPRSITPPQGHVPSLCYGQMDRGQRQAIREPDPGNGALHVAGLRVTRRRRCGHTCALTYLFFIFVGTRRLQGGYAVESTYTSQSATGIQVRVHDPIGKLYRLVSMTTPAPILCQPLPGSRRMRTNARFGRGTSEYMGTCRRTSMALKCRKDWSN